MVPEDRDSSVEGLHPTRFPSLHGAVRRGSHSVPIRSSGRVHGQRRIRPKLKMKDTCDRDSRLDQLWNHVRRIVGNPSRRSSGAPGSSASGRSSGWIARAYQDTGHRCHTRCGKSPSRWFKGVPRVRAKRCAPSEAVTKRSRMDRRCIVKTNVVRLAGVHHLKLPVRDIARSEAWYGQTLGYQRTVEFRDGEKLMGILMNHPDGGPPLALRLDPDRAKAAAGFDYFIIGVPATPQSTSWPRTWTHSASGMAAFTEQASAGSCLSCTTRTGMRCASTPWSITLRRGPTTSSDLMTPMNSANFARGLSGCLPPLLTEPTSVSAAAPRTAWRASHHPPMRWTLRGVGSSLLGAGGSGCKPLLPWSSPPVWLPRACREVTAARTRPWAKHDQETPWLVAGVAEAVATSLGTSVS